MKFNYNLEINNILNKIYNKKIFDLAYENKISNIDLNNISSENLESIKKSAGFYEKYGSKITPKSCITTYIKNDVNDIEVVIDQEKIMLFSSKKINLMDAELNEFLLAYKNMFNKKIKVVLCENYTGYDY